MKKLILLFLLTAIGFMPNLFASNGESAEEIARLFLMERLGNAPSDGTIEAVKVSDKMAKKASAKDLSADFFSYNGKMRNSDCFVLMMNSESGMQVIGYGDNGKLSLDNMPDAMREMLTYIKEAKAAGANSWGGPTCKPVAPLIKTQWGQGKPFNNACPTKNGEHLVTGCTATAMAQVLNYWKSDNKGLDIIEYVDGYSGKEISVDFTKITYNWSKMLDRYEEGKYTAEQAEEVARLMYECGVSCKAEYGYSTSAPLPYVALDKYYNYNAELMYREWQPTDVWMKRIQEELLAGRPIIYGASTISSSHAFVLDGIDTENFVHINWGWEGEADGYYDITYCKPSNSDDSYYRKHNMIVGISPRKAGDAPYQARPECVGFIAKACGVNTCYIEVNGVTVNTYGPYEYYVGFALVADGEIKYKPAEDNLPAPLYACYPGYYNPGTYDKVSYEGDPVDGNYEMRLVYKTSKEENWKLMPMNENGIRSCVVKNGKFTWTEPNKRVLETFLLGVKPVSDLIGKTDMWLEVSAIQKSGAIHDLSNNHNISFRINFVSVDNGKVYECKKYINFGSSYTDITDTAIIGPICPTNPDNGFRIPGGKYKVVPADDKVKMEKDIFIDIKPQVGYPILSSVQTARLRKKTEYQNNNISMYSSVSLANKTDGKVSVNVYACPVDGGKEILLSTIRDIQPFQGQGDISATIDLNQPYNYYPLEGGYVFKVRQLTPDGERDMLNPFISEVTEYIYHSTQNMPKLVLSPVSARTATSIEPNQPSKIKAEIMNQGSSQVSGTVTAYIYEKSKGITFEAESNPVTIDVNGKATATFDVQFPTDGVYEVYFRAFENKIMVLDMSSDQAVMTVTVGNGGISDMATPSLKLYPNPATEVLNIEGLTEGDNLEIYTADGIKVISTTATAETEAITVENLQSGIYFVNINGKAYKFVKK